MNFLTNEIALVLIDCSIKSTVILIIALISMLGLKIANRNQRSIHSAHRIWLFCVVSMLALPILTLSMPNWSVPIAFNWLPKPAATRSTETESIQLSEVGEEPANLQSLDSLGFQQQPQRNAKEQSADNFFLPEVATGNKSQQLQANFLDVENQAGEDTSQPVKIVAADASFRSSNVRDWFISGTVLVWLVGVVVLSIRLILSIVCAHRIVKGAILLSIDQNFCSFEIPSRVSILQSDRVFTPVVTGIFRHRILLPVAWKGWTPEKLDSVLAHESAHVQRNDAVTRLLAEFCCLLYWFHPLAWISKSRLEYLSELACDQSAAISTGDRFQYAKHLLEIAAGQSNSKRIQPGIAMAKRPEISSRIETLLDSARPLTRQASRFLLAAMLIVGVPTLLVVAAAQPNLSNTAGDSEQEQKQEPAESDNADDKTKHRIRVEGERMLVKIICQVFLPDGNPALNFNVNATTRDKNFPTTIKGNQFEFEAEIAELGRIVSIAVASKDGRMQSRLVIPYSALRARSTEILKIHLKQARTADIKVIHNGKPVAGANVEVNQTTGVGFSGVTDSNGIFAAAIEGDAKFGQLFAWTEDKVGGYQFYRGPVRDPKGKTHIIELFPTRKQKYLFVDQDDQPVSMLPFETNIATPSPHFNYIPRRKFSKFTTDENGEAIDLMFPDWDNVHFYPEIDKSQGWYRDGDPKFENGVFVIRLARSKQLENRKRITGRIKLPKNEIGGFKVHFGSFQHPQENRSDRFDAMSDENGNFSAEVIPGATYCVFVDDQEWVSNDWSGILYDPKTGKSETPELELSKGGVIKIEATCGPDAKPLTNQQVGFISDHNFSWDEEGELRHGNAIRQWYVMTDENGKAITRGEYGKVRVSIYNPDWRPEFKIEVVPDKIETVKFHRPNVGKRIITGQIILPDGVTDVTDVSGARVQLFPMDGETQGNTIATTDADGNFETEIDGVMVAAFAKTLSGDAAGWILDVDPEDGIELKLQPTVAYHGQIFDADDEPVVNQTVRLLAKIDDPNRNTKKNYYIRRSYEVDSLSATSDPDGKFVFKNVPTGMELILALKMQDSDADLLSQDENSKELRLGNRFLVHGEKRELDVIRLRSERVKPPRPIAQVFDGKLLDCRLSHTHCLVLLTDGSQNSNDFIDKVLGADKTRELLQYLPIIVNANTSNDSSRNEFMKSKKFSKPAENHVGVIVFDGNGKELNRLDADMLSDGVFDKVFDFVRTNAPSVEDGQAKLDAALAEAKASNKSVWLQFSQTRCAPCFVLSRWLEKHSSTLEKNYVLLKIDTARDKQGSDIWDRYVDKSRMHGIPFTIIVDAQGKLLADSVGPLGNVGYPSSWEGQQTFRKMISTTADRLEKTDIDLLINSLRLQD